MKGYEPILTERNEKVKPVKEFFTEVAEFKIQTSLIAVLLCAVFFHLSSKVQMMPDYRSQAVQEDLAGLPLNHPVLMKHTIYPN